MCKQTMSSSSYAKSSKKSNYSSYFKTLKYSLICTKALLPFKLTEKTSFVQLNNIKTLNYRYVEINETDYIEPR